MNFRFPRYSNLPASQRPCAGIHTVMFKLPEGFQPDDTIELLRIEEGQTARIVARQVLPDATLRVEIEVAD